MQHAAVDNQLQLGLARSGLWSAAACTKRRGSNIEREGGLQACSYLHLRQHGPQALVGDACRARRVGLCAECLGAKTSAHFLTPLWLPARGSHRQRQAPLTLQEVVLCRHHSIGDTVGNLRLQGERLGELPSALRSTCPTHVPHPARSPHLCHRHVGLNALRGMRGRGEGARGRVRWSRCLRLSWGGSQGRASLRMLRSVAPGPF